MPVSVNSRSACLAELVDTAGELAISVGTSYRDALRLSVSDASDLFESRAFAGLKKSAEGKQKLWIEVISRIDNVSKGLSGLGKLLHAIGKRR
jgi:hypothetical protein